MKAYNKLAAEKEMVKHKRKQPLPDGFVIVEVRDLSACLN